MSDDKIPSRIDEELYILSRQYGRTLLLLDQFSGHRLQDSIAALKPAANSLLLDDPIFKDDNSRAPLLVELLHKEISHHLLLEQSIVLAQEHVGALCAPHYVCGWLYSDLSLERVQTALRQRLDARYPKSQRIYFRYFDPRVMPRLSELLSSTDPSYTQNNSNFAQLMGPILSWCQLDRQGQWLRHENVQPISDGYDKRLNFDENTAAAIDRIEAVNLTTAALARRGLVFQQCDDARIDAHVLAAQRFGLLDVGDQVSYAWRAMQYADSFVMFPSLKEMIEQALIQALPLDVVLDARFDDFSNSQI